MATNAEGTGKEPQKDDPFKGFISESFVSGEPVVEKPAAEKPADPPAAESKAPAGDDGEKAADEGSETPQGGDPKKPAKTFQERINEVTRARREAERARDASNARIAELERQIAEANQAKPKEDNKEQPEPVDPNAPNPESFTYGELDPKYIAAVARYESKKEFDSLREGERKSREQEEAKQRNVKRAESYEKMMEAGNKVHEDFFEKVIEGAENGVWKLSNEVGEMLLESEVGADIAYHLATNPEEASKLFDASPREQARMFGKLELRFEKPAGQAAASADDGGKPAQPKTPKAPPPVDTARGAGGKFEVGADTDDFAAFERKAMQR